MSTNLKGVSSMKLHRDLGITQKSAWYMAHRIREAWDDAQEPFDGEVEVDESFFGCIEGNKHNKKKQKAGRGTVGKTAVVGMKDRETNKIIMVGYNIEALHHEGLIEARIPFERTGQWACWTVGVLDSDPYRERSGVS